MPPKSTKMPLPSAGGAAPKSTKRPLPSEGSAGAPQPPNAPSSKKKKKKQTTPKNTAKGNKRPRVDSEEAARRAMATMREKVKKATEGAIDIVDKGFTCLIVPRPSGGRDLYFVTPDGKKHKNCRDILKRFKVEFAMTKSAEE